MKSSFLFSILLGIILISMINISTAGEFGFNLASEVSPSSELIQVIAPENTSVILIQKDRIQEIKINSSGKYLINKTNLMAFRINKTLYNTDGSLYYKEPPAEEPHLQENVSASPTGKYCVIFFDCTDDVDNFAFDLFLLFFFIVIILMAISKVYKMTRNEEDMRLFADERRRAEEKFYSTTFKKNKYKQFCGVEIECFGGKDRDFSREELKDLHFRAGHDGSVSGEGYEFRSRPMNGDLLFNKINKFGNMLIKDKFETNTTCGLHIHLETKAHDLDNLKKIFIFYGKFEKQFFRMLPQSRQNNSYCSKYKENYKEFSLEDMAKAKTIKEFKEMVYAPYNAKNSMSHGFSKRYCWLNFHSIFYRNTLEIRAHSGTINPTKIINWLRIHLRIMDFIKGKSVEQILNMDIDDKKFLNIFSKDLREYIKKRWTSFENKLKEEEFYVDAPINRVVRRHNRNVETNIGDFLVRC